MKFQIYVIFDSVARVYNRPFFMLNKGEATRAFQDLSNDHNSNIGQHPEDYTLYEMGSYIQATGNFVLYDNPVKIGRGDEFVLSPEEVPDFLKPQIDA